MKIKYTFITGETTEVEVSDEIGAVITASRKAEHVLEERNRYLYIDDKALNPLAIEFFGAVEIVAPYFQQISAVVGPNLRQVVETIVPHLWRITAYIRAIVGGTI